MKHLKHAFFGELNTEGLDDYDVLWEENIPYKNESVRVKFWFCGKDDLSVERLDSFEKFLKDFDAVDEKARKALKAYLEEEPEYQSPMDFICISVTKSSTFSGIFSNSSA